jgi:hypothetical protein
MMGLIAKTSAAASSFKPVPPGMHLGRCYRIVDLGTQRFENKGKVQIQPKVMLQWEVHSEDDEGNPTVTDKGEPMSISKNYTLSLAEISHLRTDLKTWRGRDFTPEELRGFHLKNVLGAWGMLSVVHSDKGGVTYSNVASVNPVPAKMKQAGLPAGHNELKFFDLSAPDMELYESFGRKLQEKIAASPEWQELKSGKSTSLSEMEDDIPF